MSVQYWWKDDNKLRSTHTRILSSASLLATNPTWTGMGLNFTFRAEKLATEHLSHGTIPQLRDKFRYFCSSVFIKTHHWTLSCIRRMFTFFTVLRAVPTLVSGATAAPSHPACVHGVNRKPFTFTSSI